MDWRDIPSLSALRAFEATARLASFSAAGRELNVTHAAVSQQVRQLERELGTGLVERAGRGVAVTPDGAALAQSLSSGFQTIRDGVEAIARNAAGRPLHVTMTPSFALHWFMPRLGDYISGHPETDLAINPTAQQVDITDGRHDIAIRFGEGDWPGLDCRLLISTRLVIVGAPSLVGAQIRPGPAEFARFHWFEEQGSDEVERWMRERGLDSAARGPVTELPGHLMMPSLLAGHGIAAMARVFVEDSIARGDLVVLWEDQETEHGYYLVTRPGPLRPVAAEFARWLRQEAAKAEQAIGGD